jgi:hypothetical protein
LVLFGLIGAKALYLLIVWLLSAIVASWLSDRKGFGEKPGLATGLLLTFVGVIVWLVWPAKDASRWKIQGPLPWGGGSDLTVAEARAAQADAAEGSGEKPLTDRGSDTAAPKASESAPVDGSDSPS